MFVSLLLTNVLCCDSSSPADFGDLVRKMQGYILCTAVEHRDISLVKKLIEDGAPVGFHCNALGVTLLHKAVGLDPESKEMVRLLVEAGAPVDGELAVIAGTPLHSVLLDLVARRIENNLSQAELDHGKGIVQTLLDAKADPNAKMAGVELTPLHLAARLCDEKLVQQLMKAGANPELCDSRGVKLLELATETCEKGFVDAFRRVISKNKS